MTSVVGCYQLELYCVCCTGLERQYALNGRAASGNPAEYTGRTFSECKRQAQRHGWRFYRDSDGCQVVVCDQCRAEKRKRPST